MAIVIETAPPTNASVNNEMLFVVFESVKTADPVTYPDYRYVADIYVDEVFVAREIVRPEPLYKRGVLDISKILQSSATYGFSAASNSVDYYPGINYRVKFGEEYAYTTYTNLTVDSARIAFEAYKPKAFLSNSTTLFSSQGGIISNMPSTVYVNRSQPWELLPFYWNVSGTPGLGYFHNLRDEAGNIIQQTLLDPSGGLLAANRIRQFNIGTGAISNAAGVYATINIPITGALIQTIRYIDDCRFTPRTLVWLNPYGAYDSQSFGLVNKKTIAIEKKSFQQLDYRINPSGVVSYQSNNVMYGSKRGYATTAQTKLNLTSHLLNDAEYKWLSELFLSPEVYIYMNGSESEVDGYFLPVTITQNNYDYNTYKNSRLTPLKFEIEYSDHFNAQNL